MVNDLCNCKEPDDIRQPTEINKELCPCPKEDEPIIKHKTELVEMKRNCINSIAEKLSKFKYCKQTPGCD